MICSKIFQNTKLFLSFIILFVLISYLWPHRKQEITTRIVNLVKSSLYHFFMSRATCSYKGREKYWTKTITCCLWRFCVQGYRDDVQPQLVIFLRDMDASQDLKSLETLLYSRYLFEDNVFFLDFFYRWFNVALPKQSVWS